MASQSAPSSSSGSGSWRRLLESGVFNGSYPHRISACFQFLDADNLGYFTLRDLTERGKFVFSSLSIPPSQDTSFAVMDIFRTFDRSGTGRVHAEEFVVGIAQHVLRLSADAKLMDDVAAELMQQLSPQGITSSIVSALDDPASKLLSRCPLFCANMLALKYRVSANLQSAHPRGVSREKLARLLSESMDEVVAEAQTHFHLPASRLADLLADDFSYPAPHGAPSAAELHLKAVAAAAKRLGPHAVVWAPEGKAAATPSTRRSVYLSASGLASRPEEDDGSDDDESERAGGASAAQRRGTLPGMRRGSVDTLVGYLAELGLPDGPGSEEAFESLDHDQVSISRSPSNLFFSRLTTRLIYPPLLLFNQQPHRSSSCRRPTARSTPSSPSWPRPRRRSAASAQRACAYSCATQGTPGLTRPARRRVRMARARARALGPIATGRAPPR